MLRSSDIRDIESRILIILKNQKDLISQASISEREWAMVRKGADRSSCSAAEGRMSCCKVESVVSVDDRGQMVLPKDVREKAGVHVGDKLAVVSWEKQGKVCCISLVKVEDMATMVRDMLGPMMKEILQE